MRGALTVPFQIPKAGLGVAIVEVKIVQVCLVYNYYLGLGNPSACGVPSQATSGNNGNVMGYYYQDNSPYHLGHTASFTYDSLSRLLTSVATGSVTHNLTFVYNQDSSGRYGNMTCQTNANTVGPCTAVSFDPATNRINTPGYTYDAAGNLTEDSTSNPVRTYTGTPKTG